MPILSKVSLVDRISIPTQRQLTDQGQMIVPCAIARTGTQLYTASQLGLTDREPNTIIKVERGEADVFCTDSLATYRSAPVTVGHPKDDAGKDIQVTSENSKELQVGMLEGMPVRDEDLVAGIIVLTTQEAIEHVETEAQELSAGYMCDIEQIGEGEDATFHQRNIKVNHIAIVAKGRAGSSCRLSDEALEVSTDEQVEAASKVAVVEVTDAVSSKLISDHIEALKEQDDAIVKDSEDSKLDSKPAEEVEESQVITDEKLVSIQGILKDCLDVEGEITPQLLTDAIQKVVATAIANEVAKVIEATEQALLVCDVDVSGQSSVEAIQRIVLADQLPDVDMKGESADYVKGSFRTLVDSADNKETSMTKLIRQTKLGDVETPRPNKAKEARDRSIARNKHK